MATIEVNGNPTELFCAVLAFNTIEIGHGLAKISALNWRWSQKSVIFIDENKQNVLELGGIC